jgi:hypothetical protein
MRTEWLFTAPPALAVLFLVDLAVAQSPARHSPGIVEQRIAGLRVGDRFDTAKRLFPNLKMTGGSGVWTVRVGRNCKLEVVTAEAERPNGKIEVITMERFDPKDVRTDSACDETKIGAGLSFGAKLGDLNRAYAPISVAEPGKEPSLYRKDNGPDCLAGRSSELRSMFVYWSNSTSRIEVFSVEASRRSCAEYRSTETERNAKE